MVTRYGVLSFIAAAALWVGGTGLWWGTHSVGGADSYGYVSQADLWTRGLPVLEHAITEHAPWPEVDATLSPLGYRPGPRPGTAVPIYPAGLPIVMAIFQRVAGAESVFWVVPLMAMITVAGAAGLALRLGGPISGAFAALLLASSPTMLYATTWPMSDVAATAWWALTAFWVTRRGYWSASAAGAATALAVMTRPNLVGVALAPFVYLGARAISGKRRADIIRLVCFSALAAAGCFAVAALHTVLYGSPLSTGYGDLNDLFETSRRAYNPDGLPLRPLINAKGFITRPLAIEPALVVFGILGGAAVLRPPSAWKDVIRAPGRMCMGVVGLVLTSYLFFRAFPQWWYLRLLLPAYPAMAVLAGLGLHWVTHRVWRPIRIVAVASLFLIVGYVGITKAFELNVHRTWENEARYEAVGRFVAEELPENAALFAFQHSGSVRYYAQRLTVRFDVLHGEWLEPATEALRDLGYHPFYLVEDHETQLFNARFAWLTRLGALGWTPIAEFRGPTTVRIFDPGDHPAFGGERPPVTRVIEFPQ